MKNKRFWKFALLLLVPLALYLGIMAIVEHNSWKLRTISLIHSPEPGRAQFSPDGRTLFCRDGGSDVYICDVKLRTARLSQIGYYRYFIENGKYVVSAGSSGIVIRSMPDEKLVTKVPKDFFPVGVLADGSTLIGRMDGKDRRNLFRWKWRSDHNPKFHVRLSQENDNFFYILADKATITDGTRFWNLATGKLRFKSPTEARVFDTSPRFITFLSPDRKTVQIWNYQTGKLHKKMSLTNPTLTTALSPDGTMLATENSSKILQVDVWDVKSGRLLRQLPIPSNTGMVWGIAFSPDNGTLAVSFTCAIYLWRIK